jgi:hypothetical protein
VVFDYFDVSSVGLYAMLVICLPPVPALHLVCKDQDFQPQFAAWPAAPCQLVAFTLMVFVLTRSCVFVASAVGPQYHPQRPHGHAVPEGVQVSASRTDCGEGRPNPARCRANECRTDG